MKKKLQPTEKVFKAFCTDIRLYILQLLVSGEKCACSLLEELHISQSTLSHHMKILCEAGIVNGRKDGKWTHYSINKEGIKQAQDMLNVFLSPDSALDKDSSCCE